MKKMNKLFTLALALIMILSLAAPAFADSPDAQGEHNHVITIENHVAGYEYTAYQIFDGDVTSDGILSNLAWGNAIADPAALLAELAATSTFAGVNSVDALVLKLSSNSTMDNDMAKEFASIVADHVDETKGVASEWNTVKANTYTISDLEDGYYLVLNTSVPDGAEDYNATYTRYIMEVVRNVTVAHKGTYPEVTKKIQEGDKLVDVNSVGVGDLVPYVITGTVPTNLYDYSAYYYQFRDTLSEGLTYNGDIKVFVNDVDVTSYFTISVSEYSNVDGTTIYIGISDLLTLDDDQDPATEGVQMIEGMTAINANTDVVVTYSATVNQDAVITGPNPNTVDLIYSNDPNWEGTPPPPTPNPEIPVGITLPDTVETWLTKLTILKYDGQGKSLEGAEFQLDGTSTQFMLVTKDIFTEAATTEEGVTYYYKLADGKFSTTAPTEETASHYDADSIGKKYVRETVQTWEEETSAVKIKAFVGTDGYLTFSGLGEGTYTLTETVTPAGYNTIAPITFEIKFNKTEKQFHADDNSLIMVEDDNTLYAEIVNVAGNTLPSTGGVGTTMFYLFGSMMVVCAGVLLITKKRMAA